MELGCGAERERLSSADAAAAAAAGEDRLSALPKDVLVLILLKLTTRAAARTSVLSRSWRNIWALLPALSFTEAPEPHWLRDVFDAHQVPVGALHGATPDFLAVWLPAAARRVSGDLFLSNYGPLEDGEVEKEVQAFEFPCFEKATSITLSDFQGDAVSSVQCPCLQWLTINGARGLRDLTIHSNSLQLMVLKDMYSLSQLTVVAPALRKLTEGLCFCDSRPVANISAPGPLADIS